MKINHSTVDFYPPLIRQYIDGQLNQKGLVNWEYSMQQIVDNTQDKKYAHRRVLVNALKEQYQGITCTETTTANLESLLNKNTFTITTGHQLCIYGGPAYFFSKIIDAIKLSEELNKNNPHLHFVPVFWMASEDNDFEEVSHINWFHRNLTWNKTTKGGVGDVSTDDLLALNEVLLSSLGEKDTNLKSIINKAFQQKRPLHSAIRIFVNELLGKYGIVIVDGNHAKLKALFKDYAIKEIKESFCYHSVNHSIERLKGYKIQAKPRKLNLFYLAENYRERLEIVENKVMTIDKQFSWNMENFIKEIQEKPEIISPNVLLRPLYQEVVLPNVAYVGGAGEIAYWLELPEMFAKAEVNFPVPIVRNSYLYLKTKVVEQIHSFNLQLQDFFLSEDLLTNAYASLNSENTWSLVDEKTKMATLFDEIEKKSHLIDTNLSKVVKGEGKKTLDVLTHLENRFRKAEKSKHEQQIKNVVAIKEKLFPSGIFQERHISLLEVIVKSNLDVFETLLSASNPLGTDIQIIEY